MLVVVLFSGCEVVAGPIPPQGSGIGNPYVLLAESVPEPEPEPPKKPRRLRENSRSDSDHVRSRAARCLKYQRAKVRPGVMGEVSVAFFGLLTLGMIPIEKSYRKYASASRCVRWRAPQK